MSTDSAPERYHRRRRWPILVFLAVMLLGTSVIWFQVLKPGPVAATGCNTPGPAPTSATPTTRTTLSSTSARSAGSSTGAKSTATAKTTAKTTGKTTSAKSVASSAPTTSRSPTTSGPTITTTLGTFVAANTLATTRPADPSNVLLQVYNASKTRGQAKTLTKDLQSAGFVSILGAQNDTLYPASDLICQAEIRFGQAGLSQARTVLIVAPCAQLVMDDRIDERVDLALGARYDYTPVTAEMKQQLKALHDAAAPPAVIEGQTAAPRPLASIPALPTADCSGAPTTSR